jgi:hypothetical protein
MRVKALVGLVAIFASGCMTFQTRNSIFDLAEGEGSQASSGWGIFLIGGLSALLGAGCVWAFPRLQKLRQSLCDDSGPVKVAECSTIGAPSNDLANQV